MRLKMLTGLSGVDFSLAPGDEHEFDQAEALRHIEAGHGVPIAAKIERAVKAPVETRKKRK